jgi:hypothetical protein
MPSRTSTDTKSISLSRPAISFETARSCGSTPAHGAARHGTLDADQALRPARWQHCGRAVDAVRVVAERLMEGGQLANRDVDQIRLPGRVSREDVGFD